ncbi:MAG: glycosyltransferase [Desulfobacteraceae bacterium]|nr:MAG: glycosyltransferase [Desulfobacteraceae bacterium]
MTPEVSIIIPVFNEPSIIEEALSDLERLREEAAFEIIVVDGHPSRNTIRTIRNPGVRVLSGRKGRAAQMNRGGMAACGDILLFLHADTRLPSGALSRILSAYRMKNVSGGSFDLGIRSGKKAFRLIEKMVYFRTRWTRIPYGDQAIFIARRLFIDLGGYKDIPIMEDVDLMRRFRLKGHRIEIIPLPVSTSARRWEKEGIVSCTLRNWMLALLFFLGMSPEKLKMYYEEAGEEEKTKGKRERGKEGETTRRCGDRKTR